MRIKIPLTGIIAVILYFLSMGAFLASQTDAALTDWEMMTVISGPIVLLVLLETSHRLSLPDIYRRAMVAFMACVCTLTGAAHIINITVTRSLMQEGLSVPLYFQIGQWPSVEMAVDYLAWGLFMGLAFLCIGVPAVAGSKSERRIRIVSLFNSILCLIGFLEAIFIHESIWYAAPMGYGFGFLILCMPNLKTAEKE